MNRLLTTIVQIFLIGGSIACIRLMWHDIKRDIKEIRNIREGK